VIATVGTNEIVNSDPDNKIFALELDCAQNSINHQPGDNIAVMPANDMSLVDRLISRLGFSKNRVFTVIEKTVGGVDSVELSSSRGKNKCTLEIALTYFFDISGSPSKSMLGFLATNCDDSKTRKLLEYSSSNYQAFLQLEYSLLDVLELFPTIQLQYSTNMQKGKERGKKITAKGEMSEEALLGEFLSLLKPLRARVYSVANSRDDVAQHPSSSSSDSSSNSIHLVYKVVDYTAKNGRKRQGVCSTWLQSRKKGDTIGILLAKAKFRLPTTPSVPIIMVGAGTGISPYFSFLEHRTFAIRKPTAQGENPTVGKAVLIHGCRSECDIPHYEKINIALSDGVISDMWPAFSRIGEKPTYVQHVMEDKGLELWDLLENKEAVLYLSGDEKVKAAAREVCLKIAQTHGKLDITQSTTWLQHLITSGRFQL